VKQIVSLSLSLTHDSNTVSKQAAAGAESANPGSDDVNVVYRHQKLCRSVSDEPRGLYMLDFYENVPIIEVGAVMEKLRKARVLD